MKNVSHKKGFTLIELLIVITIIGILAAALLPSILGAPARARDAARAADLNQIVTALETYASDNDGAYPATADACVPAALATYFQGGAAPNDPQGEGAGLCASGYMYCPLDTPNNYLLAAKMEIAGGQSANGHEDDAEFAALANCDGNEAAPALVKDGTSDIYVVLK